jgi:hypothetical protein
MPRRCAPSPAGNRNVVPELSLGQQRRNYVVVAGRAAPPRSAAESRASLESACKFPRSEHDHDRWELARAPAGATATTRVTSKTSGNRGTPRAFRDQARAEDHGNAAVPQTLHDHGESNVSVVRPADNTPDCRNHEISGITDELSSGPAGYHRKWPSRVLAEGSQASDQSPVQSGPDARRRRSAVAYRPRRQAPADLLQVRGT